MAQRYGGISRYYYELINELNKIEDIQIILPLSYTDNDYLQKTSFYANRFSFPWKKFPFRRNIVESLYKKSLRKCCDIMKNGGMDVFHPTYYNPYFLNCIINKPFVLTIYDMTHEIFADNFDNTNTTSEYKKILAEKASRIIAISNHTKNDIIKYLGIKESKIDVIYLGNSLEYKESPQAEDLPKKYILFIGNRSLYKNFKVFIKAVAPLLNKDKELRVIAAGSKKFDKGELSLFHELDIQHQIFHRIILDDVTLGKLYKNARAFVFPSLYEGFGIPVLEAFACHCPAIISYCSSLIEVGGDAVKFFDPESMNSIREAVACVLYNDSLRDELIKKGDDRLKLFSWKKMADDILKLYRQVL